jgi:hypothetical protein
METSYETPSVVCTWRFAIKKVSIIEYENINSTDILIITCIIA